MIDGLGASCEACFEDEMYDQKTAYINERQWTILTGSELFLPKSNRIGFSPFINQQIGAIDCIVSKKNRKINPLCPHNERGETTLADIAEHAGNGEFGSAIRDAVETETAQAVIEAVVDAGRFN